MKKALSFLLLFLFNIFFCNAASASITECNYGVYNDPATLYVAIDGSGDYNCDGTDDQAQINAAFDELASSGGKYTSVYLKNGTYIISAPIDSIASNSVFEGDSGAIVKLKDHAGWNVTWTGSGNIYEPLIGDRRSMANVEIKCFELDINFDNNFSEESLNLYVPGYPSWTDKKVYNSSDLYECCEAYTDDRMYGLGYYTGIYFTNSTNISIHDMYIHDGMNDGIKLESSVKDVEVYDNVIYRMGHEGVFAAGNTNLSVYRNRITARISSGVRVQKSTNCYIFNNIIDSVGNSDFGAGPGVQIDPYSSGVQVYKNTLYKISGPGVRAYGNTTGIDIYNNIITEAGVSYAIDYASGVLTSSSDINISNNVFDSSYQAGIYVQAGSANIQNNIIINTQQGSGSSSGSYYGIKVSGGTAASRNNCFYQNSGGNYSSTGVSSKSGDFTADPLLVSTNASDPTNGDYHIKSVAGRWDPNAKVWTTDTESSPCIDAGLASSDYSKEPDPNGSKINIGRYGNTTQASLSGTEVAATPPDPTDDYVVPSSSSSSSSSSPSSSSSSTTYSSSFITGLPASFEPSLFSPSGEMINEPHALMVVNGSGSGTYYVDEVVGIMADAPSSSLYVFRGWYGATEYIDDPSASSTTITMPDGPVTITALYDSAPFSVAFSKFSNSDDPIEIVENILKWLLSMAGIIGFIVIIVGGIYYVASSGNEEKARKGKKIVTNAVLGLIMIILSYAIISVIAEIFVD